MRCPCRKKSETVSYSQCCEPLHCGGLAATPEALMRSRYSAFVLGKANYLLATWARETRPARIDFTPGQEWLQLKVIAARTDGDSASVEFVARSRIGGAAHALHEVSRFRREGGRWLYVDGTIKSGS